MLGILFILIIPLLALDVDKATVVYPRSRMVSKILVVINESNQISSRGQFYYGIQRKRSQINVMQNQKDK
jgi:hypothetical protein